MENLPLENIEKTPTVENSTKPEQIIYQISKKIEIKFSCPEMGFGVFTTEDMDEGELIERSALIQLSWRSKYHNDMAIKDYCMPGKHCECDECKKHGMLSYMGTGYLMIYNHQDKPNCIYTPYSRYAEMVAARNIKSGEELFWNYGTNYFRSRKKYTVPDNN